MRNMLLDVAFSLETEREFSCLTKDEVITALLKRIASLVEHWEPDAFGFCDEYELED